MTIEVRRKLIRWGNGWGLRFTADEVQALRITEGDVITARVDGPRIHNDFRRLPTFKLGGAYDVKAILEQGDE